MPTKSLYIDGLNGVVAIIRYSSWSNVPSETNRGFSAALTSPTSYPEDVFFHTSLPYMEPDPVTSSPQSIFLASTPVAYFTWSSGGCGFCFITTAVCEYMGEPDDGDTLTTLRNFRDNHMLATKGGRKKVEWYYQHAPGIVAKLKNRSDAESVFMHMYSKFIVPSVLACKDGRLDDAEKIYSIGLRYAARMAGVQCHQQ